MLMKINKITHTTNGISIEFITDEVCVPGDVFSILYEEKNYYFKATMIETLEEESDSIRLKITAYEVGYWANKLSKKRLYIGNLRNKRVTKIYDEEKIKEIEMKSCWL